MPAPFLNVSWNLELHLMKEISYISVQNLRLYVLGKYLGG